MDAFKNEFQSALKRNLHNWSQWRTDMNDRLVGSLLGGEQKRKINVDSLDTYLANTHHPVENRHTLMTYSAAGDSISHLEGDRFLQYGIPRVKVHKKISPSLRNATSMRDLRDDIAEGMILHPGDEMDEDVVKLDDEVEYYYERSKDRGRSKLYERDSGRPEYEKVPPRREQLYDYDPYVGYNQSRYLSAR